ncbi:MAG: hypothetical protein Q9N26_07430 [Aquificota bacterium]|nr:hypothetical protein [Aquificota bacterium]
MKIRDLSERQREFLKNVFEMEELPLDKDLEEFLREKGCVLHRCISCGKMVFHDGYEFWNLSECCDDNSKITHRGLLCEVCYARSPENMKYWVFFRPSWYGNVEFDPGGKE